MRHVVVVYIFIKIQGKSSSSYSRACSTIFRGVPTRPHTHSPSLSYSRQVKKLKYIQRNKEPKEHKKDKMLADEEAHVIITGQYTQQRHKHTQKLTAILFMYLLFTKFIFLQRPKKFSFFWVLLLLSYSCAAHIHTQEPHLHQLLL